MSLNKLKKWSLASMTVVTVLTTVSLPVVSAAAFSDVGKSNPHYKSVTALADQGIISGYSNGTFGVWNNMTRQQAAQIVVRAGKLKKPADPYEVLKGYHDISYDNPARGEIATIVQAGVLKGSNGRFQPYSNITREQAATMLVRSMQLDKVKAQMVTINLRGVNPSHRANVQVIANTGISTSLKDFEPLAPITRGAFATMLTRAQQVKKTGVSLLPQVPAKQPSQSAAQLRAAYEKRVVDLTNKERTSRGLQALKTDVSLNKTAFIKSADMQKKDYFDHHSPTYGTPFDLMKKHGITYKAAGENIALGYPRPESVVDAWMKSKDHRVNILSKDYTHIGVGYEAKGNYWTQHFIGK